MRAPLYAFAACCIALAACQTSSPNDPSATHPLLALKDGAHNGGNPDFFFLPPLVANPSSNPDFDAGTFNPSLAPKVVVCDWNSGCVTQVAQFTMTSGTGSETIRVDPTGEQYAVNWHTDLSSPALDPTHTYRIIVLVGKDTLGFADVDVVESGKQLKNVQTDQYIGLLDGRTLPIKFRIENAALCNPAGAQPCASQTVNVGSDAPTQVVVLYTPTGQPYGALRTKAQPGLDPGTTITFTLQPCDGFTGEGAAGYTQISDCLHITSDPPIQELQEGGFSPEATVSICTLSTPSPAPEAAGVFRQEDATGEIFELDHSDETICPPPPVGAPPHAPQWHYGLPPIGDTPSMSSFEAAIPVVATTTSLTTGAALAIVGQPLTLTATVTPAPGGSAPTVEFFDGATSLGTAPVGADGVATLTTSGLSLAVHELAATFGGTLGFSASASSPTTQHMVQRFASLEQFTAALGDVGIETQNFNSFDVGTPISSVIPQVLDVSSPFDNLEAFSSVGEEILFGYDDHTRAAGGGAYTFTFITARNAIAFDITGQAPNTGPAQLTVASSAGTSTFLVSNPASEDTPNFFAVICTSPLDTLAVKEGTEVGGSGSEEIGFDNFEVAQRIFP